MRKYSKKYIIAAMAIGLPIICSLGYLGHIWHRYEKDPNFFYEPRSCPHIDIDRQIIQDIKDKNIDMKLVLSIMETRSFTIAQVDSIVGDSAWRK